MIFVHDPTNPTEVAEAAAELGVPVPETEAFFYEYDEDGLAVYAFET